MAANDALSQLALAADAGFRLRLKGALLSVAAEVLGEDGATANHGPRVVYANKVITAPDAMASQAAPFLVMRPNVFSFQTSTVFAVGGVSVVTASGDADLRSQIATDWNWLAAAAAA